MKQKVFLFMLSLFALQVSAQSTQLKGSILDAEGEALIGASVLVVGTKTGTVSDLDGMFLLDMPSGAKTIEVSYLGYKTQSVDVGGKISIRIVMLEDESILDEVVVVGYATVKKANLTGSVDQIKGGLVQNRPVTNVAQALQGTIANLNISAPGGAPNASPTINIRGISGLEDGKVEGKSTGPLIVVDGIQGGDLALISPDDIESISVLKDAASAAIYGSSAPYGVILITTKKGKKGGKPQISYSNNFGFSQPINLPKMMNSIDFANYFNEAATNAGQGKVFNDETMLRIKDYQAGSFKDETTKNSSSDNWNEYATSNANNDWFEIFFKDLSMSQNHNLSVSGGSENSSYYLGIGYMGKDGMFEFGDDKFERYNVRTNLSSDLKKWLTVGIRGAFSRGLNDTPSTYAGRMGDNYMHQIGRKWPTVPLRNPDGLYSSASDIDLQRAPGRKKYVDDNAILTGEFIIKPLAGWDITGNYSIDVHHRDETEHNSEVYEIKPSGDRVLSWGTNPSSFLRRSKLDEHHTVNLYTSYEKEISEHYFKGMLGYTQELFANQAFYAKNTHLYTDEIPALDLTYGSNPSIADASTKLAIRGMFGRINYGYKEKYLFELNGRYDGSSRFLEDVRYKFYPGASAAWLISKECFWKAIEPSVSNLKLRASYGSLGDQAVIDNRYPFYPSLIINSATHADNMWYFGSQREANVSNPALINPELTWVTTTTVNFGLDASFLKGRLNLVADVFRRNADDFIGPSQDLPAILGAIPPKANNAGIRTEGFELSLAWRDAIKDFRYGVRAILGDSKMKVMKYHNAVGTTSNWYAGRMAGDIWGFETLGLFASDEDAKNAPDQSAINRNQWRAGDVQYADLNGDGKIDYGNNTLENPGDKKVIGNTNPRYNFGLMLDGAYKNFDLSAFFQGVGKRDAWFESNYFWGVTGNLWQSSGYTVHNDRWTPENQNGYFPRAYMSNENNKNTQAQTGYMQNASYIRLKNLQLGYSLPHSMLNKMSIAKARIFFGVENVFTLTKMIKTMDPEFSASDGKLYPLQRTWTGGVNITF